MSLKRVRYGSAIVFVNFCLGTGILHGQGTADSVKAEYTAIVTKGPVPSAPNVDLPDVSQFTVKSIKTRLPTNFDGTAAVGPTAGEACLSESFQGKRSKDFQAMQGTADTRLIKLHGGALTLAEVVRQINNPNVVETVGTETILRLPLLVANGATLVILGSETPIVRLSTKTGTLLANEGTLIVIDAIVSSWEEAAMTPTAFVEADQFRPFITSFAGSTTYLGGSTFQHLGYSSPSAYGLSLTSHPRRNTDEESGNWPTGVLINNRFEGLFYGFYSFEARDVAIVDNQYFGSIRYGIDPHDRSTRLIIAKNVAAETVERHGIIGSRGISNSFIFDNVSRNNAQSGIMLDRQCTGNVVVNNRVFDNGNGIAFYESPNNRIVDNVVAFNTGNGIRVRNSMDVLIQNNSIVGNGGFGVSCEGRHLDDHEKRVARGDTYEVAAGVSVYENAIAGNGDGMFKGRDMNYLRVGAVRNEVDLDALAAELGGAARRMPATDNDPLGGDLEAYDIEFQAVLRSSENMLEITREN